MTSTEGTTIINLHGAAGGQGTTVCVVATAHHLANAGKRVLIVDYRGDVAASVGIASDPDSPTSSDTENIDTLRNAAHKVNRNIDLIAFRPGAWSHYGDRRSATVGRIERASLGGWDFVIVDAGSFGTMESDEILRTSFGQNVVVCAGSYTALRRAVHNDQIKLFLGVIVHEEVERPLRRREVSDVLQLPVLDVMERNTAVSRAHDAGVMMTRMPANVMEQFAKGLIAHYAEEESA